ncbi:trimeric intracellular cation channel family protein [Caulobacter sp. 17J80-11]|uniref:trimeric intracellular cation channel family protein n=1 Tax=Caulobacter sp. 17J80-11 TaxID=2763502 RepID=UPI00165360EA|nr:trimeric intracellular cation channel family protein [Caulobacter sp. 17J80-11]
MVEIPGAIPIPLVWLDYAGVALFAATGALAAARRKQDLIALAFFGAFTGIGGGTLRDLLLDAPVFWTRDQGYLAVCLLASVAVWVLRGRRTGLGALLWLDAIGLAAYTVVGAAKAEALGFPALVCVVMGVLTSTFGGVVRDVLSGEPSVLMRREIYITAALLGAGVFVGLGQLGVGATPAGAAGAVAGFALRAGALRFGWRLPAFPGAAPAAGRS